jgi:hypothetical protein
MAVSIAVGFGDSLPRKGFLGTNVTKLLQTSRSDGVLLKPAHTALRLDVAPPHPNGPPRPGFKSLEVWAAASVPARPSVSGYAQTGAAGLLSAASDRRANSFARLVHVNGSTDNNERWWYTLLATDTSSINVHPSAEACAPVGNDGPGKLMMTGCGEESMLQLKPDGSLRTAGAPNLCVVAEFAAEGHLTVGSKDCVAFSKLGTDGTLRSGSKCLASNHSALILANCSSKMDGITTQWTTTDSMTGSYVEQRSEKPIRIKLSTVGEHGSLDIQFVPGVQSPCSQS